MPTLASRGGGHATAKTMVFFQFFFVVVPMCDFSLLGSGNAEPGCHILSPEHEWREGPPMTQARTQHTLTVVGDKIGELPLLKGQCHQSFQLEDFFMKQFKNLVTMSLYPPLGLFSSGKKGRIVHYTEAKMFRLCENLKKILKINSFPQYFASQKNLQSLFRNEISSLKFRDIFLETLKNELC